MFKRLLIFVAIAALCAISATSALAKESNGNGPIVVYTQNCPDASLQKTYTGHVIVYVSEAGCVSVDRGAVAVASGNAVVVAHGNSTVVAKDNVVLVIYSKKTTCRITPNVQWVNATGAPDSALLCKDPKSTTK